MNTFVVDVVLEKKTCGKCGGVFALNAEFVNNARDNKGGYTCPYCLTYWSWSESEADRLRKQIEEKSRELTAQKCETLRQQNLKEIEIKTREAAERKLKRVAKGVCPCCKRTFPNLARHMETKHSEQLKPATPKDHP